MTQDERGYLTIPHELAAGVDCNVCLVVEEHADMADLVCNSCGTVVDTVPIDRVGSRLMELASAEMCSALCPHSGSASAITAATIIGSTCAQLLCTTWPAGS